MADRVVPTVTNALVCGTLLALTLATTLIGRIDLGAWNLVIALAIAGAKATLIILFFMHVRWSSGLTRLTMLGGLLWLGILVLGAMDDYVTRAWLPLPGK
jgi:cytochrome c oxidase subunit IV